MRKPTLPRDNVTVIVGGGSIGLCTAYNLAKSSSNASPKARIVVIEAFDKPFRAASSTCTGCFHYGFPESESQPLLPLGKYSFDLWAAEAEDSDFREATGYRAQSSFGINNGGGQGLDKLPDWVQKQPSWLVDTNVLGSRTATVDPTGVGKWLTSQCLQLGVEIYTSVKIVDVGLSADNGIQAVTCVGGSKIPIRIDCTRLLLACGAWTPTLYKRLFPNSPIQLHWTTKAGDWILCKNPCPTTQASVAYVSFANLVGEKMEFAGRVDGTIWACGRSNITAHLPPPGEMDDPDERLIDELGSHARKWLNWACKCKEEHADSSFRLVAKGRGFRPATKSGLPIISKISPSNLANSATDDGNSKAVASSGGLFVCWGHGSYGLTLGMGSGRLMSQLMNGDKPDIDLTPFSMDGNGVKFEIGAVGIHDDADPRL